MPIYKMDGKKDGKQKYRVRINYTDSLGNAKQIDRIAYGSTEAKLLEQELTRQIKHETPAQRLTVNALYIKYLEAKKAEVRETTFVKSQTAIEHHILPYLADVKIEKLTAPVLQEWKQAIEALDLSIRTRKNIYSEFRTMLNWAVKMDYLPKNPLLKVGNFKAPLEIKKEMDYYTPEEFRKFINVAKESAIKAEKNGDTTQWHYYVFFAIAFYTGLRKGEIHALQWTDIKDGYLYVTKSLTQKLKGGDKITPPKNKSSIRTLQLPQPLINILNEHHTRCAQLNGFREDYKICGGTRALRDTTIQNANERFAKAAGIKTIRIHDFRHSHASVLANEGINIQEISRRLGHSDISMTLQTYSHLYPREEERAINILNKIV